MSITCGSIRLGTPPSRVSPEASARVVAETAARRGVLIVPAFAIGRAQDILYHLRSLQRAGTIPADLPIYLDSPMAASAVDLYCRALSEHDLEMETLRDEGRCPIEGPSVHIVRDRSSPRL